jgi:hypothetical protein
VQIRRKVAEQPIRPIRKVSSMVLVARARHSFPLGTRQVTKRFRPATSQLKSATIEAAQFSDCGSYVSYGRSNRSKGKNAHRYARRFRFRQCRICGARSGRASLAAVPFDRCGNKLSCQRRGGNGRRPHAAAPDISFGYAHHGQHRRQRCNRRIRRLTITPKRDRRSGHGPQNLFAALGATSVLPSQGHKRPRSCGVEATSAAASNEKTTSWAL